MTPHDRLWRLMWPIGLTVLIVWSVTILALHTANLIEDERQKEEWRVFDARPFSDFMPYYGLFPIKKTVAHGALAVYVSDSEVLEVPPGGFRVDWNEHIECDFNPYDGEPHFDFYREVKPSGRNYTGPRARTDIEKSEGWIAYQRQHHDYGAEPQPIRYPKRDADCRLYSFMVMSVNGSTKWLSKLSEIVHVRGGGIR